MFTRASIILQTLLSIFLYCTFTYAETVNNDFIRDIVREARRGSMHGQAGIYGEFISYDKDLFVEDCEITELNDSSLIVPYIQANYESAGYGDFSFGAGLTAYTHINGEDEGDDEIGKLDGFVFHELYLAYEISHTSAKLGRLELEDTLFLSDYYKAVSFTSHELDHVNVVAVLVKEVAEADISKFIEFQNINRDDSSIDDYLFAVETTWHPVPDVASVTAYYYHQGNLYDLFGSHIEILREADDITLKLNIDIYVTDEDNTHGLRDINDETGDSSIYHINPSIELNNLALYAGYMETDSRVGARVGGLLDDYFNPLNEGDNVYSPDARTWYGGLTFEYEWFYAGVVFGKTDYQSGSRRLREEELDISFEASLFDHIGIESLLSLINSDSAEGDTTILELAITYDF